VVGGPFEVRGASPEAAPAVVELFRSAYRHYYNPAFLDEAALARYLVAPENTCFVALGRDRVVGFAALTVEGGQTVRLTHLVRHPTEGRGAGAVLEAARQDRLTDLAGSGRVRLAYAHCLCSSPASEALKLRHGFRPVAIKLGHLPDVSGSGQRDSYVVVVKRWRAVADPPRAAVAPAESVGVDYLLRERVEAAAGRAEVVVTRGGAAARALRPEEALGRLLELAGALESVVCYVELDPDEGAPRLVDLLARHGFFAVGFFPGPPGSGEDGPAPAFLLVQHLARAVVLDPTKIGLASDSSKHLFEAAWARYQEPRTGIAKASPSSSWP
jgi:hypothetical protein